MNDVYLWNQVKNGTDSRSLRVKEIIVHEEGTFLKFPEMRYEIALKICWELYERPESGLFLDSLYEVWIMYGVDITPEDWIKLYNRKITFDDELKEMKSKYEKFMMDKKVYLKELYERVKELLPTAKPLVILQDNIRNYIYEKDDTEQKNYMMLYQNVEYGAIHSRFPEYKFIPIDFEHDALGEPDENVKLPADIIEESEVVQEQIEAIDEDVFSWNPDKPKQPELELIITGFDSERLPPDTPSQRLWINEWKGIIQCGLTGAVSWGYFLVKDNKLVWDGFIPKV